MRAVTVQESPFFLEPHGYRPDRGPLARLRHYRVAIDDGYVLVARDGRAWRCYRGENGEVELPGTVTRSEAEAWLEERYTLYERED